MITAIVIPADISQPIHTTAVDHSAVGAYQRLVGGWIEAVRLEHPPATLYLNEEGKLLHLPVNQRATTLAWRHNRLLRGRDLLVGDAVLVGPTDRRGNDTTVPDTYLQMLGDGAGASPPEDHEDRTRQA